MVIFLNPILMQWIYLMTSIKYIFYELLYFKIIFINIKIIICS